jgi:hypothetical protein
MTVMMVATTATFKIMTKTAMLLLLLMMMMMNRRSSFQTVLQRCWQSFSPGLKFTTSFFPLNYHIQSVTAIYLLSPAKLHPLRYRHLKFQINKSFSSRNTA